MANMSARKRGKRAKLSQEAVDKIVIAQADDDSEWEEPVKVERDALTSLLIPWDLAARAAFLAKLHKEARVEEWLARIIRERIELEEVAFGEAKRELAMKGGA